MRQPHVKLESSENKQNIISILPQFRFPRQFLAVQRASAMHRIVEDKHNGDSSPTCPETLKTNKTAPVFWPRVALSDITYGCLISNADVPYRQGKERRRQPPVLPESAENKHNSTSILAQCRLARHNFLLLEQKRKGAVLAGKGHEGYSQPSCFKALQNKDNSSSILTQCRLARQLLAV